MFIAPKPRPKTTGPTEIHTPPPPGSGPGGAKTRFSLDASFKLCFPWAQKPCFHSMLPANHASQGCKNKAFARCFLQIRASQSLPEPTKTKLLFDASWKSCFPGVQKHSFRSMLPSNQSLQELPRTTKKGVTPQTDKKVKDTAFCECKIIRF